MYEKFFQFNEPPFNLTPDPRFFFFSKKHEEAFDHIRYGIQERKGFIVVTGEVGTGKTTLSRLLLEKLDKKIRTAIIFNPSLSTIELLQAINHDFGIPGDTASKKRLVASLNQFLLKALAQGDNALLIVDEGQNLSVECLEEIRMLSNLETEKEKLLQILLIGQPELREKLKLQELRQLNQRIAIRYHIEPLNPDEMKAYVAYRLKVAGGRERVLFTPKSLEKIHQHSEGIPRLINILCDKALLAAFAQESRVVDDAAVSRAASELEGLPSLSSNGKTARKKSRQPRSPGKHGEPAAGRSAPWIAAVGTTVIGLLLVLLAAALWGRPNRLAEWFNGRTAVQEATEPAASIASGDVASVAPSIVTGEVKPLPVPVIGPEPAAAPQPQEWVGRFDDNGVFRVTRPEETHAAALLTLLNVWGVTQTPTREEFVGLDGDRFMSDRGLAAHRVPADLMRVRLFDYPCLIRGRWTHGTTMTEAVLVNLTDHDATVLDPLNGRAVYDLDVLQTLWGEEVTIYWKKLPGIELPLRSKGADPSVKTVQKALRVQGLYLGKADGILGPNTKRAIRFFQQKYGLKDTTIFGPESYLVLSRVMLADSPRLQVGDL